MSAFVAIDLFRSSVQQSIVRLLVLDTKNEMKYHHLLFPSNSSELNLLNHLLDNFKQQQPSVTPLLKLTKKIFKSATVDSLPTVLNTFIQSISSNDDRAHILLPLLEQHEETLRLVEHNRPSWIKFCIIYILLGVKTIQRQENGEYIEVATSMMFKLLKKLSKEVSVSIRKSNNTLFDL